MQTIYPNVTAEVLIQNMLQRVEVLIQMRQHKLHAKWVQSFPLPELSACCVRMEAAAVQTDDENIQKELICNPAFAEYYAGLLKLRQEEEVQQEPAGTSEHPASHITMGRLTDNLSELLEVCRQGACDITSFPAAELLETLAKNPMAPEDRLTFLHNFAPLHLSAEDQQTVASNLSNCVAVPYKLNDEQIELFLSPFMGTRTLFSSADFPEIWELFQGQPVLVEIAEYLHYKQISETLSFQYYQAFSEKAPEYLRLMNSIFDRMDVDSADSFMACWQMSGCPLKELQTMARRIETMPDLNLEEVFSSYPGYINLLYGQRFKSINLSEAAGYQEDVLLYAIVKNKKHFIHLVDAHAQEFLALSRLSLLFDSRFYDQLCNLNSLTEADLKDLAWMQRRRVRFDELATDRKYTFPELRLLYDVPEVYYRLYAMLVPEKLDYRIKVLKQLLKRKVLAPTMSKEELCTLADRLNEKPLYDWLEHDFGHITGLRAADVVQILIHRRELEHLLPTIQNRTEALLALRHIPYLEQFASMSELKENIVQIDQDWRELSEAIGLSEEFLIRYQESILCFLGENGAQIANTYRSCLSSQQASAFLRVVKAELMGKLSELKYFAGDLQRELNFPLTDRIKTFWQENLSLEQDKVAVQEHDDFFSTMLLGVQPRRTCLSYEDGQHRNCLLAGFDSNKKVLYATIDGQIVGRTYLRLTKGRLTRAGSGAEPDSSFTFVDLEHVDDSRRDGVRTDEFLTLFLERSYISGIDPENEYRVNALFVQLAERKAKELGSMLVLSGSYHGAHSSDFAWTKFDIYISKTKAGAQYLDSLSGEATVAVEGSYQSNSFLVLDPPKDYLKT